MESLGESCSFASRTFSDKVRRCGQIKIQLTNTNVAVVMIRYPSDFGEKNGNLLFLGKFRGKFVVSSWMFVGFRDYLEKLIK